MVDDVEREAGSEIVVHGAARKAISKRAATMFKRRVMTVKEGGHS